MEGRGTGRVCAHLSGADLTCSRSLDPAASLQQVMSRSGSESRGRRGRGLGLRQPDRGHAPDAPGVPGGIDPSPLATSVLLPPDPIERGFKDTFKANHGYSTTCGYARSSPDARPLYA